MATIAPERTVTADEIVAGWLTTDAPINGLEHPAGPLFNGGYSEYEITMTGGGPGWTGNCCYCSGSYDPNGWYIHCC
jgi:hypothetical protein